MEDVTKRARELVDALDSLPWAELAGGGVVNARRVIIECGLLPSESAFIAASPDLVRGLLAENDRLRTVIYEAACALYDYDSLTSVTARHTCANAYAILDAATPKAE